MVYISAENSLSAAGALADASTPDPEQHEGGGLYPLTSPQREIWFDQALHERSSVYNIGGYIHIAGAVDPERFERAFNLLMRKHDCLRTVLFEGRSGDEVPTQTFAAELSLRVPLHDFSQQEDPHASASEWMQARLDEPFALFGEPLTRSDLLKLRSNLFYGLLQFHHIIVDGWSIALLCRSLAEIYSALEQSSVPDLTAHSYVEFIHDDRRYLEGRRFERQRRYWLEKYKTLPEPLLKARYPGAGVETVERSECRSLKLSRRLYDQLVAFARSNGSTTLHVILAALYVYFVRTCGREELVTGIPVLNRGNAAQRATAGLFVGISAVRFGFGTDLSFAELLRSIARVLQQDYRHQRFPVSELNREVVLQHTGRQQLFDLRVSYERHDHDTMFGKASGRATALLNSYELTPLTLHVREFHDDDDVEIDFVYNRSYFQREEIDAIQQRLLGVLNTVMRDSEIRVGHIPLVTSEDVARLEDWNQTRVAFELSETLVDLFEQQVARRPDAPAVSDGVRRLSYAQLNACTTELAHRLSTECGVRPEVLVGLCVDRSVDLVIGMLAVLKAGGAYVPLDPAYPQERLQFIIGDSGATVLLTQPHLLSRLPGHERARVLLVDADLAHRPCDLGQCAKRALPANLAYVLYTSGSTGQPKGVAIEHRNAVSFVRWAMTAFTDEELSRTLFSTSLNFDLAVYECFVPLSTGACIEIVANAMELVESRREVSLINTVPSVLDALLQSSAVPHGVRTVNLAGEPLPRSLVERLFVQSTVDRVCNLYGPTETTTYSTWMSMRRRQGFQAHIGRPIANTRIYILDCHGDPVPPGAAGEIYIGGAGVARGYLQRPKLTAQRFLIDPFSAEPGARMYRTGDLGRYLPHGNIEYLGRNDSQVKIRGYRIELGEIEARLQQHAGVREAVVLVREGATHASHGRSRKAEPWTDREHAERAQRDEPGEKLLVAYVVPQCSANETVIEELSRNQVEEWLHLWGQTYESTEAADELVFDGWNSSYTRLPVPQHEMRDWLIGQLERIEGLQPKRVLEIGCGGGMILRNLAPRCEQYVGTDLSAQVIDALRRTLADQPELSGRVHLLQAEAKDFSALPPGGYDTVILNSTVQYLPSLHYLQQVIEQAIERIGSTGRIFLGDVRHYGLLEAFHLSVQIHQARPEVSLRDLATQVSQKVRTESELLIDPAWFFVLKEHCPQIRRVQVLPKAARYQNEMSAYRYDVVLWVGGESISEPCVQWLECQGCTREALQAYIADAPQEVMGLRFVPNPRVHASVVGLSGLADERLSSANDLKEWMSDAPQLGMTCFELTEYCAQRGYAVSFSWIPSHPHGEYHALIGKQGVVPEFDWGALAELEQLQRPIGSDFANDPLRARRLAALPQQLREHLLKALPEHMVPAVYVVLDAMPRTPNGKLDRKALPVPEILRGSSRGDDAPVGEIEHVLAHLWGEVLGVEIVGRKDHFFELGGQSLLAMRVISRLRELLAVDITLASLFAHPVLDELAQQIRSLAAVTLPPITVVERRPGGVPLSFAQQRLWFLAQLEGMSLAYHMGGGFRLSGKLDVIALRRALNGLVKRHETLRTTFRLIEGQPMQFVDAQACAFALQEHDLHQQAQVQDDLQRLINLQLRTPFDLEVGPLIRGALIRLSPLEHILFITMHHIVSDGWSIGVMQHDLAALYSAYRRDSPATEDPLPKLACQYIDYALWQRRWLDGQVLQRQAAYWQKQLAEAPVLLELPTDRPRPLQQDYAGAVFEFELDEPLVTALKNLSRRHGTTLFMTLLGAWATLMSRLSGQQDVVIGTPVANRVSTDVEALIGCFINTLALRLDVSGSPTVAELFRRVKTQIVQALQNQDLPFEQLVEMLRPQRNLSHHPLFQVMFSWQDETVGLRELSLPGLQVELLRVHPEVTKFDLTITLGETDGRMAGALEYATALFDAATIERYAAYLQSLLRGMVSGDEQPIDRLPLLSESERHRLLVQWNDTQRPYPQDRCIHELFEEQVQRTPDALALVHEGQQLSYAEMNKQANGLAHHLRALGVQADSRVAMDLARSAELVVAQLAILKCGAVYVPLDEDAPLQRTAFMLTDCVAGVVLSMRGRELPKLAAIQRLDLDGIDLNANTAQPESDSVSKRHGSDVAYVMYTSGSTGEPKGVEVPHRGISRLVLNNGYADFGPTDRVGFAANPAFDANTLEMWSALLNGGCLVVIDRPTVLQPQALRSLLREQRISVLWLSVGLFNQIAGTVPDAFGSLRYLMVGGDALDAHTIAQVLATAPPQHLLNGYGPTETTTFATTYETRQPAAGAVSLPIGRPIANTRIYILDGHAEPVPLGVAGEIYIGGAGVARGYLNRPELTAERFMKDPFSPELDARMYRTGDVGRHLPDGNIEFLGRNDHQVKIRGYRIELGEIEARLRRQSTVREAVVVAREDVPGEKRLVAYVVSEAEELNIEQLRAPLLRELPEYMLPAAYVRLESLPLTINGKLNRRALPAPEGSAFAQHEYHAPQGALESELAQIWSEVLQVPRIGRQAHFFELGGHSLLAVKLMERMRRRGLYADIRTLFMQPTLMGLAEAVRQAQESGWREAQVPANDIEIGCEQITPQMLPLIDLTQEQIDQLVQRVPGGAGNIQDIYPLAPLQEGMLFHHLLQQQGDAYLLATALSFDSRERLDGFVQALQLVIRRHDILRTAVLWEGLPEPVQVVWRQATLPIEEVQLDGAEGDIAEKLWARFDPRRARIDVRQAPLMHLAIAQDVANDRWIILLRFHHLAVDHTALKVIQEEVALSQSGQEQALLSPIPFRNFMTQVRLGVPKEEHERFFRELLGDVQEPTAPYGVLQAHGDGADAHKVQMMLGRTLQHRIRHQARYLGVSAASVFHWAWAQVLGRVSGRDDVIFGTVLFGRLQGGVGADRALGLLINTLPIRVRLGEVGVAEGIQQTHESLAQLVRHEHASLALAQRCSGVPAHMPLFSALLNYRHSAAASVEFTDESGMQVLSIQHRTNYPCTLSVDDRGSDFELTVQVVPPLPAERLCRYMHQTLEQVMQALEQAPQTPACHIEVLDESERHQLLVQWNATQAPYAKDRCVHELFEEQVERTPDAVAVVYEGQFLSYTELNAKANQLARYLRQKGVGPDQPVAIGVERSLEMVVGLLGILKAGGAYVPLDPGYPAERLAYMLQDTAPKVLLIQERLKDKLPKTAAHVVTLDQDWHDIAEQSASNLDRRALGLCPHHLMYVIYTSGSTGEPKGAMNEHRALINLLGWLQDRYRLGEQDRVLQKTPFSFDVSVWEFFWTLLSGARLIMARPQGHQDPEYLRELIEQTGVTTMHFVPSMLEIFLEQHRAGQCASVRRVMCGGETLSVSLQKKFFECFPGVRLSNMYGPSEAAIDATSWECQSEDPRHSVPIGRPIANARIYILDGHAEPVPLGVAGEIHIGGAGVARGYLNRPELTAQRFVKDPFSDEADARMYRTGDVGRYWPDGNIEFLGRNDHQVKIRGYRIELGEIEARLRRQSTVREAVVLVREGATHASHGRSRTAEPWTDREHAERAQRDVPGEKRLVAYVVSEAEDLDVARLRDALSRELPDYMVPSAYVRLEALPLTPNGKLDRRALPAPQEAAFSQREYEAPHGELESALARIWSEVLQVQRIGRQDHFFELGGHSLLAVQMMSRVRRHLGLEVSLQELFTQPVLQDFACLVSQSQRSRLPELRAAIERPEHLPLSYAQQRLWFIAHMDASASAAYHMPAGLRLRGPLDERALLRALDRIVARHEVLRTRFELVEGGLAQRIAPARVGFRLQEHDLRSLKDAQRQSDQVHYWRDLEAHAPFDLQRGPLIRGRLLRLAEQDHILLVTMHHIVSDGWSTGVLTRELSALYRAFSQGQADPLPPLNIQYADYALWQRQWLAETMQQELSYWKQALHEAPELIRLPTDQPRPEVQDYTGGRIDIELEAQLSEQLRALSRRHGTTLHMTLLSGWAALVGRLSGQQQVVIGTPVANRTRAEVEGLIGFFVNALALRVDLSGNPSVGELLEQVRRCSVQAQSHQEVPFDQVVEALSPSRSFAHSPVFQLMFAWRNTPGQTLDLGSLNIEVLQESSYHRAKYDLTLGLQEAGDRIVGDLVYASALYERSTMQRHVQYLKMLLQGMAADDRQSLDRLPLTD